MSSFSSLPVELIHYLFQYLDISTIFFSFRYVCKRFHTIVETFDRYKLDMQSISKSDFDRICSILCPEKIFSIILANDMHTPYQIPTFLSRFSFDRFIHLRSLSLNKIEENNLFAILMHLSNCSLQSLTIDCSAWCAFSYTIRVLFASTIAKSNLERLDLNIAYRYLDMISWPPLPITLKYLRIERCTFQEYCMILRHNVNLRQFHLTDCLMYNSDDSMYRPTDVIAPLQLTSLSFGPCFMRMKELLIFLSCTPRLQQLKLIIWTDPCDSVIDGKKWENFLSEKLSSLKKFQFFFDDDLGHVTNDTVNIQSYLQSFRTPFWIEDKHWYVTCDYIKSSSIVRLYTLPICNTSFTYHDHSKKVSDSTWNDVNDSKVFKHHVRELNLNLNELIELDHVVQSLQNPIFCEVTRLTLNLDGRFPYTSLTYLQTIVDFSSLIHLSMKIFNHHATSNSPFTDCISSILKKTVNIQSLNITLIQIEERLVSSELICSIIPHSVKHLQISITNLQQMKKILERLHQLLSVTFYSPNISKYYEEIKKWIHSRRKDSLCREGLQSIQIWLGIRINPDRNKTIKKSVLYRIRHRHSN